MCKGCRQEAGEEDNEGKSANKAPSGGMHAL